MDWGQRGPLFYLLIDLIDQLFNIDVVQWFYQLNVSLAFDGVDAGQNFADSVCSFLDWSYFLSWLFYIDSLYDVGLWTFRIVTSLLAIQLLMFIYRILPIGGK